MQAKEIMNFEEEMESEPLTEAEEIRLFSAQLPLYEKEVIKFRITKDANERYSAIARATKAAYMLSLFSEAKQWSEEMSAFLSHHPKDWNYGNIIYYQNWVSGMFAFDSGNIAEAKYHLTTAGNTVGSPQLNSFGPNMKLAKNLLKSGEVETFQNFLDQIEIFWKHGKPWIKVWRNKVNQGLIPNCTMHMS